MYSLWFPGVPCSFPGASLALPWAHRETRVRSARESSFPGTFPGTQGNPGHRLWGKPFSLGNTEETCSDSRERRAAGNADVGSRTSAHKTSVLARHPSYSVPSVLPPLPDNCSRNVAAMSNVSVYHYSVKGLVPLERVVQEAKFLRMLTKKSADEIRDTCISFHAEYKVYCCDECARTNPKGCPPGTIYIFNDKEAAMRHLNSFHPDLPARQARFGSFCFASRPDASSCAPWRHIELHWPLLPGNGLVD